MNLNSFKILFFLIFLCCNHITLFARQSTIPDSTIIQQLLTDAKKIRKENKNSAFVLIEKARVIAEKNDLPKFLGDIYSARAETIKFNGVFLQTLPDYKLALEQYRKSGDSLSTAFVLSMLGANYMVKEEYTTSLNYYLAAANINKKYSAIKNRKNLGLNYRNIGNVFRSLKDFEQAESYIEKGLEIFRELKDTTKMMDLYDRVGLIAHDQGDYQKALPYFEKVINFREAKSGSAGHTYMHMATTLDALERDKEAIVFYNKAITFGEKRGRFRPLAPIPIYRRLADFHKRRKEYDLAFEYLNKAKKIIENHPDISFFVQETVMKDLGLLSEEVNDFESALTYYKKSTIVKDSLSNERSSERLSELRATFETEQKELEINQLKILESERTKERNILIGGVVLLGLLGWYIFYLWRKNRQQLAIEISQKDQIQNLLKEKNQLYEELQNTQDQLIHNEKMISLGQLTAGIAHEINNPINFVSTSTQALNMDFEDLKPLLEKIIDLSQNGRDEKKMDEIVHLAKNLDLPYLKDEINTLLESVTRGVTRTEKIIAGLKIYSRKEETEAKPSEINGCLREVFLMLKSRFNEKFILHQDLTELPLVNCQIDKLHQVFLNLIGNAIDALEDEGSVFVKTQKRADNVIISIRDTGHGIDEAIQQRIFEPFFTTKKIGKGTGLGLFISYGIIKQHGGTLEMESKKGEGTTFNISLPLENKSADKK